MILLWTAIILIGLIFLNVPIAVAVGVVAIGISMADLYSTRQFRTVTTSRTLDSA